MIHTPVHASWLNQIEIFFSVIQKKVVSPNDFTSLGQLSETLLAFTGRYNQTAKPFNWKFTAADLAGLLRRISEHEQAAPRAPGRPRDGRLTPGELTVSPAQGSGFCPWSDPPGNPVATSRRHPAGSLHE